MACTGKKKLSYSLPLCFTLPILYIHLTAFRSDLLTEMAQGRLSKISQYIRMAC